MYNMIMNIDWSSKRRLIIIGIVATFVTIVVIVAYFVFRPARTCFDGKKNQNERGVDCGGKCSIQCKADKQELKTLWTKVFNMGGGIYDVAALIENQNIDVAVKDFKYTVELLDESGRIIVSNTYSSFAKAGDHFLLFSGGLNTGGVAVVNARFTISPDYIFTKASVKKEKEISVVNYNLISPDNKPRLVSEIQNETTKTFTNFPITAMISDKNGPIAVSQTFVEELGPRERKTITYTWPSALKYEADTEKCEKPIDVVLVMDRSGSMMSDGENPSEPLTSAKNAARNFISKLTNNDRVGYLSFATNVNETIDQKLTSEIKEVDSSIFETEVQKNGEQFTNIADALKLAKEELTSERIRGEAKQTIVFLTDGEPTYPKNPNDVKDSLYPTTKAIEEANSLKEKNIELYIIGLGSEVKTSFLSKLATYPEYYYPASSGSDLYTIYNQIGQTICKKPPSVIEIIPRINEIEETTTTTY